MSEQRLAISFSGGRTSAVMLDYCLQNYSDTHSILIPFANTGCEHEATLEFVDAVDRNFCRPRGHQVVWIEAQTNEAGKGPTAKIVDFETASRDGEPFESAIAKHGIFCKTHPNCTGRLKTEPIHNFLRQRGWEAGSYDTAIGIRKDEMIRVSRKAEEQRFIYPLVDAGYRKGDVNRIMSQYDWDLKIPHHGWGNCTWCWKKSYRKLMTVTREDPSVLDFPGRMERKYGMVYKGKGEMTEPRTFFRERNSAQDILRKAFTEDFIPYEDEKFNSWDFYDETLDAGGSCAESCEIGADE